MTNTIRKGDRVVVPVEATIRYASLWLPAADLTLHLSQDFGTYDAYGKYTLRRDIHVGSYPIDNVTKVVPPVKVGDVIDTSEALAALPGGTILREPAGLAVRRSTRSEKVYVDGMTGEVPSYDVTLPLTVLFVPEATR